jgi:uncharacterized membrane protein YoaK (UPF0700 family)
MAIAPDLETRSAMNSSVMTRLLSLNAGFVDTVDFLGLQGLFAAHVTGNFVTLAAAFVYGSHGTIGKIWRFLNSLLQSQWRA